MLWDRSQIEDYEMLFINILSNILWNLFIYNLFTKKYFAIQNLIYWNDTKINYTIELIVEFIMAKDFLVNKLK
jgi:hypothetical protein